MRASSAFVPLAVILAGVASGFRVYVPYGRERALSRTSPRTIVMSTSLGPRPFDRFSGLSRLLDDGWFNDPNVFSWPEPFKDDTLGPLASFKVDVTETDKEYVVKADVPGVSKDDVHISVDDRKVLSITAERTQKQHRGDEHDAPLLKEGKTQQQQQQQQGQEKGQEGDRVEEEGEHRWSYSEISYGKVQRAFKLPENADTTGAVRAALDHGVLTITLPKKPSQSHDKHRTIQIE